MDLAGGNSRSFHGYTPSFTGKLRRSRKIHGWLTVPDLSTIFVKHTNINRYCLRFPYRVVPVPPNLQGSSKVGEARHCSFGGRFAQETKKLKPKLLVFLYDKTEKKAFGATNIHFRTSLPRNVNFRQTWARMKFCRCCFGER